MSLKGNFYDLLLQFRNRDMLAPFLCRRVPPLDLCKAILDMNFITRLFINDIINQDMSRLKFSSKFKFPLTVESAAFYLTSSLTLAKSRSEKVDDKNVLMFCFVCLFCCCHIWLLALQER